MLRHSPNKSDIQRLNISAVVQFHPKLGVNLFLCMKMYDDEFATKEDKNETTRIK